MIVLLMLFVMLSMLISVFFGICGIRFVMILGMFGRVRVVVMIMVMNIRMIMLVRIFLNRL